MIFHQKAIQLLPQRHRVSVCNGNIDWGVTKERLHKPRPIKHPSPLCPVYESIKETNNHFYWTSHQQGSTAGDTGGVTILKKSTRHASCPHVILCVISTYMDAPGTYRYIGPTIHVRSDSPLHLAGSTGHRNRT